MSFIHLISPLINFKGSHGWVKLEYFFFFFFSLHDGRDWCVELKLSELRVLPIIETFASICDFFEIFMILLFWFEWKKILRFELEKHCNSLDSTELTWNLSRSNQFLLIQCWVMHRTVSGLELVVTSVNADMTQSSCTELERYCNLFHQQCTPPLLPTCYPLLSSSTEPPPP